jgi:tripartite-type tricarboxylate transporter receptor subunit TctC
VPTISESGFPGYDLTGWYGLLAPAATSGGIVELLNGEIRKIVQSPDIQEKFANLGLDATGSTPERFKEIMRAQIQTLAKIIKDAGVKTE